MIPQHAHYDVVIIGAGMVGAALACALTHAPAPPLKLLLVEASRVQTGKAEQPGFDARSTVLSAGTVDYLKLLGLWQTMAPSAAVIEKIAVSDQGHFGGVQMNSGEAGVTALGHVVENAAIGRALNAALLQNQQLELCSPVQVTKLTPHVQGMQLALQSGEAATPVTITASLVVLAEGGRSGLAQQLGIHFNENSYGQRAIIANVAALLVYFFCAVAALELRRRNVQSGGIPFRVPGAGVVPILACVVIIGMLTSITLDEWTSIVITAAAAAGLYVLSYRHRAKTAKARAAA